MQRRDMLTLSAGAALGPLRRACAQGTQLKRLGFLTLAPSAMLRSGPNFRPLVDELRRLGWEDGRNVVFVFPSEQVHAQGFDAAARQLVADKVDVIYCAHEIAASAAQRATKTVPIVAWVSAAVELGFAKSLARPGGNVTGLVGQSYDEQGKVMSLLREIRPGLSRVGVSVIRELRESNTWFEVTAAAGRAAGIHVVPLPPHLSPDHIAPLLEAGVRERVQVLVTGPDPWLNTNEAAWRQISDWAITNRVVTKAPILSRGHAVLAFGAWSEVWRVLAEQLDRVLRGANPAELPFIQPTQFDIVINQRLARAVGWPAPRSVLLQATEVIE